MRLADIEKVGRAAAPAVTLADLERVEAEIRDDLEIADELPADHDVIAGKRGWADTIAAYIARAKEQGYVDLEAKLAASEAAVAQAYEDGRISACNAGKPGCPRAAASEAACKPFLKDGETPAECITRWRSDAAAVLELLRQEKLRSEKAEAACAQMREALDMCSQYFCGGPNHWEWDDGTPFDRDKIENALATDAGKEQTP